MSRYGIFAGTTTLPEWRWVLEQWSRRRPPADESLIAEYEGAFADACGATHAISFGAGRMALYAILEALGVGANDEVILPAFTCVVVPNAILYHGARPVYVDIEPRTFNIDVDKVRAAVTPRTKALYAQHTFGVPCDVEALKRLGRELALPVIEDGAHALGATYHGRPVGSLTEAAFFSTDHSKMINTQLGGMAVTSDDRLAARLRQSQQAAGPLGHEATQAILRTFLLEYRCWDPRWATLGRRVLGIAARAGWLFAFRDELMTSRPSAYPCRLSPAQAWLGLSQLEALHANLAHRRAIAACLDARIQWAPNAAALGTASWLRYSFLVRDRQAFEAALAGEFDLGLWFTSVVEGRATNLEAVGYRPGSCPVAEFVCRHIVNFPTHPRLPLDAIRRAVDRTWPAWGPSILRDTIAGAGA